MTAQEAINYIEQHNHIDDEVKDMCIEMLKYRKLLEEDAYIAIMPKDGVYEINGVDVFEAVQKQIPKKPEVSAEYHHHPCCPTCKNIFDADEEYYLKYGEWTYCGHCGQKIEWSLEE